MRGLNRESMNKMSAVDIRVILYGVVAGLLIGATQLGNSVDRATALGLAMTIEISVGIWLGTKLWLAVFPVFSKWLTERFAYLEVRLEKLESEIDERLANMGVRFDQDMKSGEDGFPRREDAPIAVRLTIWCIVLIPFGTTLFAFGSITAIMAIGLDIHSTVSYLPNLIVGATLALVGIATPCLNLLLIERHVRRSENILDRLDRLDTTVHRPVIQSLASTNDLNRAYGWTNSLLGKLVGYKAAA